MKSRKRFQVRCVLILILSLLLTACESGKSSEKKEEDKKKENVSEAGEVSKEAQAVIETMMTAPNPDLLFTPSVIGEGVEEDEDAVRKNTGEERYSAGEMGRRGGNLFCGRAVGELSFFRPRTGLPFGGRK